MHRVRKQELQVSQKSGLEFRLPRRTSLPLINDLIQGDFMRARMFLVFVLLAVVSLSAQTFRGTILGTVTDPSGAVVSGAKVTVKNVGTGLERTTETSADGSYALPELPIGTYTVTVTLTGFQTSVTTGVEVDVATERRVDSALKTGAVSTKVEVSGDLLPQVETTTNTLGGVLTAARCKDMPVNGRDYTKLIYLNPAYRGLSRPDLGFARFFRRILHERRARTLQ